MNGMPIISRCDEAGCFYNRAQACHAPAITVGASHPRCDTFAPSATHIARQPVGMVGACHVSECRHNRDLTCGATAIVVGHHQDHPDCTTFDPVK